MCSGQDYFWQLQFVWQIRVFFYFFSVLRAGTIAFIGFINQVGDVWLNDDNFIGEGSQCGNKILFE